MMRYEEKPFLRFLDGYVLWAIDALDDKQQALLDDFGASLGEEDGAATCWRDFVSVRMHLPEDFAAWIKATWTKVEEDAARDGRQANPTEFARLFVDVNFPN
ncbi:hypothetical protein [Novosphingobium soli]|uniref:Uncharacterized protein n=1 Tax=Novosphingobium soli TaxID=574956 RepID=A0ABV6CXC2_9SPHN